MSPTAPFPARRAPLLPLLTPLFALLLLASATGCASRLELVEPPLRHADLYPGSLRGGGVVVAVDALDARRARRYFGADLRDAGLLPSVVVVSNRSGEVVSVGPADVLAMEGRRVVDPVRPQEVARRVAARRGLDDEGSAELAAYLASIAYAPTVVPPGETVQGVVFFDLGRDASEREPSAFRLVSLLPRSRLWLRVAATEQESGQRMMFGPFRVGR